MSYYEKQIQKLLEFHKAGDFQKSIKTAEAEIPKFDSPYYMHFLLGIAYGALNNVEKSMPQYNQAIKLKPDFWEAYHNRGTIFLEIGDFSKAVDDLTEAAKLSSNSEQTKVNLALALNNWAVRLHDIGNIEGAIEHYEKAITIQPTNAEAFRNLTSLFAQIPALFSPSLKKSIDHFIQKESLQNPIILCYRMIYNLIEGNSREFEVAHNMLHEMLISNENINASDSDVSFCFAFVNMTSALLKQKVEFEPYISKSAIYHIGESHCLSFAHHKLNINEESKPIRPKIVLGAKVWHFANTNQNRYKKILMLHAKSVLKESIVFLSFGEIDCRQEEGYIKKYSAFSESLVSAVERDVNAYVNFIKNIFDGSNCKIYFFSVPAPVILSKKLSENDNFQINVIKTFNDKLCKSVMENYYGYIDTYEITKNKDGYSNMKYHSDKRHLSPSILPQIYSYISRNERQDIQK